MKLLAQLGDVNPTEHGGGFLVSHATSETPVVEWCEVEPQGQLSLHMVPVPLDILEELSWVSVSRLSSFLGTEEDDIRTRSKSEDLFVRALLLVEVGECYGWHELDHSPNAVHAEILKSRWGLA